MNGDVVERVAEHGLGLLPADDAADDVAEALHAVHPGLDEEVDAGQPGDVHVGAGLVDGVHVHLALVAGDLPVAWRQGIVVHCQGLRQEGQEEGCLQFHGWIRFDWVEVKFVLFIRVAGCAV